jgi:hypothetical protein
MVFQNDILAGAAGAGVSYQIDQSIRFNDNDSAYLSRTTSGAGNRKTFTISLWFKRGNLTLSGSRALISAWTGSASDSGRTALIFNNNDNTLNFTGYSTNWRSTNALFRDPSAWYHVVVAVDTTQATADDRIKMYINSELQTSFQYFGNPSLNADLAFNDTASDYYIAYEAPAVGGAGLYDGYESEIYLIDGQALAPTDFGETNDDGVWVPKAYAGTYGTNGFYITGEDSADLGADYSGNANDFTSSGLTSDDQRGDTPTANHATWNPLFFRRTGSYKPTFADGNLYVAGQSSQVSHTGTTISSSGKHYAEFLLGGTSSITGPGVVRALWDGGLAQSYASNYGGSYYGSTGNRAYNATSDSQTAPGANRVGIEVDFANNEVEYFIVTSGGTKTSQGGKLTSANGIDFDGEGIFTATLHDTSGRNITAYFEEADWYGTPNAGYKALSTANLPTPAIADGSAYFQTTTYTGAGYPTEVNQSGNSTFQPDFVWVKRRNGATTHDLFDAVRGVSSQLYSNLANAEGTVSNAISFDADGFTAAADPITGDTGSSGNTFVGWQWLAANGTASNTDGSITSTVSANTTAGFSVVNYTGTGANATVGHGLASAPEFVVAKSVGGAHSWRVWHKDLTSAAYIMYLDASDAQASEATAWNSTAPTSSVISLGSSNGTNKSSTENIIYSWHSVEGFSKFGKYTGNGSADGPFVWCGFRPAYVLIKVSSTSGSWFVYDTARDTYNASKLQLFPNLTSAEDTSSTYDIDIVSNGFKIRSSNGNINTSSGTHIFMAFAEHPLGGDGVAPVPAR